jgi:predicted phosphodiesterase
MQRQLGRIAALLNSQGIDIDEIGEVTQVKPTTQATLRETSLIQFSPKWENGPEWPVIKQGPVVRIPVSKVQKRQSKWAQCFIFPDIQIGYFTTLTGQLEPIHDERAIDVALRICTDVNPDLVVLVGDNLDLAELGKYVVTPAYQRTTQATIDRATLLGAQLRKAAPNAKIVWLAGNHEERLPKYLLMNASASFGLKRGNLPNSWPVMSVPFLCRLDEVDIEYRPGYPAAHCWITPELRVIHGDKVASGGSTAHKYLSSEKVSVIYGHIHRREWAERTRDDFDGPRTVMAASPGCLCRVDGAIPSVKGGIDLDGRPLKRTEDWQQGIAVIPYDPETGKFVYEQVAITDGFAMYRGKEYEASASTNHLA